MDSEGQGTSNHPAALLLIIGEPFSEDHKQLILEEITKGFRSWDVEESGININEELAQIANRASLGEEGVNGERLIQHQSDNMSVEILVNPLAQTVKSSFKKLLMAPAPTKYVIYAGHAFQGTGAWVLQDDVFAFNNLAQVFKNVDVENALKQNIEANLTIHTLAENNWGTSISRADFTNNLRIQLNPPEKMETIHGVIQFTAYIGTFLKVTPVTDLLQASEQFGNISFTRPTLYIFPGCQGDSALFGINGFNLLVNGGYNRKACFWDFARHLDRVDAMLLTHLGTDNIFGVNAALQRKTAENIHPQIGYLYFNAIDKPIPQDGNGDKSSLLLNLAEEANKMTNMAKQLGIAPQSCTRPEKATTVDPINLYHKLGHGSLDMYILNPVADSKELKELYQLWGKQASNLGNSGPFALPNAMSVCTLLVWKPYNPTEKIVRILFPGNAPQHKVAEGLEKMKTFAFLKQASCTAKDLQKPAPVKKGTARPGSGTTTARGSARSTMTTSRSETSRNMNSSRLDSPRKPDTARARPTSAASPTKTTRSVREETKASAKPTRERPSKPEDNKAKPSSARSAGAASPTKTGAASPRKTPSPTKGSSAASPTKASSPAKSPSPAKSSPTKASSPAKAASPPKSPSKAASPEKEVKESQAPVPEIKLDEPAVPEPANAVPNHTEPEIKPEVPQAEDNKTVESAVPDTFNTEQSSSVDSAFPTIAKAKDGFGINGDAQNGDVGDIPSPVQNGDNEEEEVRPQALPEPPVIVESPSQESPVLPDYSSKIESDQQELSEFSQAELELEQLDNEPVPEDKTDPAQDIPSSPEPAYLEEHEAPAAESVPQEDSYKGFEAPVFSNDEPNETNGHAMEQKIQYGIDESSRAMAGIQEVDEEDQEEGSKVADGQQQLDKEALREMGIYDEDDEEEEGNAFEKDDLEDEVRHTPRESSEEIEKHTEEGVEKGDLRSSAERQFEDVDDDGHGTLDEGIADVEDQRPEPDQSSLPAAFDKDSSPEVDADSIEGGNQDEDKDVDETAASHVNGQKSPSLATGHVGKAEQGGEESDDELKDGSFDPVAQWGQPMGLPSPPPPSDARRGATSPTKASDKRPASSTTARTARTARNGTASTDSQRRPGTAPAKTSRPGTATRRPGSSRSSPQSAKVPPLPPLTPFYMDLTYIPNHGEPSYSDVEFFKRVRARYYVLSALSPNPAVLDSLMEAKATWEQKDLEVTLIPTYDNETLRHWMGLNKEKLQDLHIDMTPAVSRCTIQLQDLETSLPAYRLEV